MLDDKGVASDFSDFLFLPREFTLIPLLAYVVFFLNQIALLTSKTRQATVTATDNLRCLTLDRRTYTRVMGPLTNILMRNMEEYTKIQAAII